jgi:RNA recognition motif-containing protein
MEPYEEEEWRTTVMLRNMPNNYTREMLLELADAMGFANCYDFAYLPIDFKSQAGLGYAFINFISSEQAQLCFERFEGFADWQVPSEKRCTVTWGSPYQGLEAHIERYQNSPVMHHTLPDEWKPVLLQEGVRIPFPAPTKPIKTPKIRQQANAE